jgi:hypothetical protein
VEGHSIYHPSDPGLHRVVGSAYKQELGGRDKASKSFEYRQQALVILWRIHPAHMRDDDRVFAHAELCSYARTVGRTLKARYFYSPVDYSTARIVRPLGSYVHIESAFAYPDNVRRV